MPVKIFFCYAHEDEKLLNRLKDHLKILQRQNLADVWHDRDIKAGTQWEHAVSKHLNDADIILLLVSANFMNSDYCYSIEMKHALERYERGEARVIPIILRPVLWQEAPFSKLQALPRDATPVTSRLWENQDVAFHNVAEGILKIVKEIQGSDPASSSNSSESSRHNSSISSLPSLDKPFQIYQNPTGWISSVVWSPDGKYIASGGGDNTVYILDALTGHEVFRHQGHRDVVYTLAWSPDSTCIASGSKDKSVQIWNIRAREMLLDYRGHAHPLSSTDWVLSVDWSHDGHYIASGSTDETVRVWTPDGNDIFTFQGHVHGMFDWRADSWVGWVLSVAWSPDGTRIASSAGGYGRAGWRIMDAVPVLDRAYDKTVKVWDAMTGNNVSTYEGHDKSVTSVNWSPDGTRIASASRDTRVHIWNAAKPDPTHALIYRGHTDRVNAVAWSPNGRLIASAGDDKTVRIWSPDTPNKMEDIRIYRGHTNRINTLTWSPDGTRIASAGDDQTIWVWPIV